jgi:hypothetical protein
MDDGEEDVHERGGGDDSVQQPEERSEQPAGGADRDEDRVVDEREQLSGRQVQQIPDRLGAGAIPGYGGAEQEGRSTRVMPNSLAARRAVVSTSVPTKPPARAAQTLIRRSPR